MLVMSPGEQGDEAMLPVMASELAARSDAEGRTRSSSLGSSYDRAGAVLMRKVGDPDGDAVSPEDLTVEENHGQTQDLSRTSRIKRTAPSKKHNQTEKASARRRRYAVGAVLATVAVLAGLYGLRRYRQMRPIADKQTRTQAFIYLIGRRNASHRLAEALKKHIDDVEDRIEYQNSQLRFLKDDWSDVAFDDAMEVKDALVDMLNFLVERQKLATERAIALTVAENIAANDVSHVDVSSVAQAMRMRAVEEGRLDEAKLQARDFRAGADKIRRHYAPGVMELEQGLKDAEANGQPTGPLQQALYDANSRALERVVDHYLGRVDRLLPHMMEVPEADRIHLYAEEAELRPTAYVVHAKESISQAGRTDAKM
ncbi:hypothetical protein BESB_047090 [Besnoitia besnoiti]|uniref:Transmembrane protein n=1 Tax=Besnoitia besnoiti TaxID=94643 RepID=A0A2A9MLJ2_BESBE|nr:hypothetical protein BESB_047090 [Besnoitia besnoiti]PFH36517.1 hypothetical protein BESB_047090 [Besnoitia besnoiti]